MAGGDEFTSILGGGDVGRVGAALMLMGAGTNMYDAYSAVMSSPWSTEKFTQSPEEEEMARRYVRHATIIGWAYAIGGAVLARSIWPIVGAAVASGYMYYLYDCAVKQSPQNGGPEPVQSGQDALAGQAPPTALPAFDLTGDRDVAWAV